MLMIIYRCDNENDKHVIYIAKKDVDFPPLDEPNLELFGSDNIVPLKNINVSIEAGEAYKWRVDCVESSSNKRREGDVWVFTMIDGKIW